MKRSIEVSEIRVTYQNKVCLDDAPQVKQSRDAFEVAFHDWEKGEIELCESFKILLLNRANKVKGIYELSRGGLASTIVDPRLIFSVALKTLSASIILVHNHPSGNTQPSQADIDITRKLKKAGEVLDISVLDHLIITPQGRYYSFADEGLI